MADKTIGELPSAQSVTDGSLIPLEQSGTAMKMTGAQFKDWAISSVSSFVQTATDAATAAGNSATAASGSATAAGNAADRAEGARDAILNMDVEVQTLDPGSTATVSASQVGGVWTLDFGIPRGNVGEQGQRGIQGERGEKGEKGDTGTAVGVATSGLYYFAVDNDTSSPTYGHLFLTYTGDEPPNFSIDQNTGHLLWTIEEEEET